jgi:hypothetical protein
MNLLVLLVWDESRGDLEPTSQSSFCPPGLTGRPHVGHLEWPEDPELHRSPFGDAPAALRSRLDDAA